MKRILMVAMFGAAACGGSNTDSANAGSGGATTSGGSGGLGSASSVAPSTTGQGGGAATSNATTSGGPSAGSGGMVPTIPPGNPGASDFTFAIDTTAHNKPISPYIYGANATLTGAAAGLTLARMGGNRLTAYNWETNAWNAGSDYLYENDALMSTSTVAGLPMQQAVQSANDAGASIIMTVPIAGWVSADEKGPCPAHPTPAQIAQRFQPILPAKGSAFKYPPDLGDGKVYADEFVSWLESQFPNAQTDPKKRIFYMLDNEPDAWSSEHSEIHPTPVTYAELIKDNIDYATAIKAVAPKAVIFGPVNYGWAGYVNLQSAPDGNGRDWLDTYLAAMKAAETSAGKRLVDVLDLHWYPEATGGGARVVDDGVGADEVTARVQAPRSLWDPTYVETSWITQSINNKAISLIPLIMSKIDANYPGTKFSVSEYNYGAGADISGGVAQADVLGIFGSYGVFAGAMWALSKTDFIYAAFQMYRNYDGAGHTFGDTSVSAVSSATADSSVYASIDSSNPGNVVVVAINKDTAAKTAGITLKHPTMLSAADVYVLTSQGAHPQKGNGLTAVAANAFSYSMPPMSVTTLVFHP